MAGPDVLIAFTIFANSGDAGGVVRALVQEKLAACGTILPGAVSIYHWEGNLQEENEVQVLLKTHAGRIDALRERLIELHPYETPEFFTVQARDLHPAYADWVAKALS